MKDCPIHNESCLNHLNATYIDREDGKIAISTVRLPSEVAIWDDLLTRMAGKQDLNDDTRACYETMVFAIENGEINFSELDYSQYMEYDDAMLGHGLMVKRWSQPGPRPASRQLYG